MLVFLWYRCDVGFHKRYFVLYDIKYDVWLLKKCCKKIASVFPTSNLACQIDIYVCCLVIAYMTMNNHQVSWITTDFICSRNDVIYIVHKLAEHMMSFITNFLVHTSRNSIVIWTTLPFTSLCSIYQVSCMSGSGYASELSKLLELPYGTSYILFSHVSHS